VPVWCVGNDARFEEPFRELDPVGVGGEYGAEHRQRLFELAAGGQSHRRPVLDLDVVGQKADSLALFDHRELEVFELDGDVARVHVFVSPVNLEQSSEFGDRGRVVLDA